MIQTSRTILILAIFGLGLAIALPVLAVEVEFEVQYPPFGGVSPGGGPAGWVRYIFFAALALTSIAAVGSLIYAGIVWMTSASSERVSDAKSRIWAAVIGIALVAGSVVILRTINPDLVSLRQPTVENIEETFQYQDVNFNPGTAGGKCTSNSQCPSSLLTCDIPTSTCRIREGFSCNRLSSLCENGTTCNTNNICYRPPNPTSTLGTLNGPCRPTGKKCDNGLTCNAGNICKTSINGVCSQTSECFVGECREIVPGEPKQCLP